MYEVHQRVDGLCFCGGRKSQSGKADRRAKSRILFFNPRPEPKVVFIEACRAQALSDPYQIIGCEPCFHYLLPNRRDAVRTRGAQ
jgi:hypothetical protein